MKKNIVIIIEVLLSLALCALLYTSIWSIHYAAAGFREANAVGEAFKEAHLQIALSNLTHALVCLPAALAVIAVIVLIAVKNFSRSNRS